MKIKWKRILAYILAMTILMGNTVSASAMQQGAVGSFENGMQTERPENSTEMVSGPEESSLEETVQEESVEEASTNQEESVEEELTEQEESTEGEATTQEPDGVEESTEQEESTEEESFGEEESIPEESVAEEDSTEESVSEDEGITEESSFEDAGAEGIEILGQEAEELSVILLGAEDANGQYLEVSRHVSLQEAFNAIELLNQPQNYYRIELTKVQENVVSSLDKKLVFPKKTAELVIAAGTELTEPYLYFKGNLALGSNTVFEDIILAPASKTSILLDKYSLTLSRCEVYGNGTAGIGAISGSGINGTSQLILKDSSVEVGGSVNKVGTLIFSKDATAPEAKAAEYFGEVPGLFVKGKINIGNINLESDGILAGTATVTRKKGVVTKVVPLITISGEVLSEKEKTLYLDIYEDKEGVCTKLDLSKEEMQDIRDKGIYFAKAPLVTYPHIKALQRNEEDSLIKTGGYLTYYAVYYGATLSFMEGDVKKVIPCRTIQDAITEINNRKVKRDYVITLTEDCAVASGVRQDILKVAPKALTMPDKKYISSLVIQAEPSMEENAQLGFLGNLTFTSDVTLCNVDLVQMIKVGDSYKKADEAKADYPTAVTLKTGGFDLAIVEDVTINTPILLNGGKKGNLVFERGSSFITLTNDQERTSSDAINIIYGSLTGFHKVKVDGCELLISEYQTARNGSYKASVNNITELELVDAKISVIGNHTNAALTVKNLLVENAEVYVGGKLLLTNVVLDGSQKASVFADREFVIGGTLTSRSNNATLLTRLKGKGKAPYLIVNGTVIRENGVKPIYVGVYNYDTAPEKIRNQAVVLENAPKVSAQLLTAKKALAVDFRPFYENYKSGSGEYHKDNTSGYMMMKSGSNVYVYEGSKVKVAVYVKSSLEEEGNGELFGFFPSFKEASAAVNKKKDRSAFYTFVLMEKNGVEEAPVSISLPAYAKQVTITSIPECDEKLKTITFSGNITLGTDTVFKDVILEPVLKSKGTSFSIVAAANDLTLEEVRISDKWSTSSLKDISGNGKPTIVLDSQNLHMTGSVTKTARLVIKEDTQIDKKVQATVLCLENNHNGQAVTFSAKGSVTINDLENTGALQNTLAYTRTSKNVTNLTIKGYISNDEKQRPVILKQDSNKQIAAIYKRGEKVVLDASALAAVMPKASTDSFVLDAVVVDRDGRVLEDMASLRMVKAKKGIYFADTTQEELLLSAVDLIGESNGKSSETYCLDYTQAVNEINNRADKEANYTICFTSDNEPDLNLMDAGKYSAFVMPKKNTKASLTIQSKGEERVTVSFIGAITTYGNVTLKKLLLSPVKSASNDAPVNVKMTAGADATGATLQLKEIATKQQLLEETGERGYISAIHGIKNKTKLVIEDCEKLYLTSGINDVKSVSLRESRVLSAKDSVITELELDKTSAWVILGKFLVTNVKVPEGIGTSYVGVKQNAKGKPLFTIGGNISSGMLLVRLFNANTESEDGFALFEEVVDKEIDSYLNVPLALAKKAEPLSIRAYAYRAIDEAGNIAQNKDGVKKDNFASYKVDQYVLNGTQEMLFSMVVSQKLRTSVTEAGTELEQAARDKALYALIYMTDSYEVKEAASKESATVATLKSAHTVQVLGMEVEWKYLEDENEYLPNIWYYVQFYIGETLYKGYVEESFLAYSDEVLLQWKEEWQILFPNDRSLYAMTQALDYSDVSKFPTSYQVYLKKLKESHPNWTFVPMNVGRQWSDCVDEQMGDYSWIYYNQPAEFRGEKINSSWYYASRAGIEYYMDPRNFLTESDIFQFEQNTYNASYHTQNALQNFLNNTFMAGKVPGDSQGRTYAYVIWNSGKTRGLSPFNLAARVIQEQGIKGTSAMISGTYAGYEGYYNHYNIQASGTTDAEVIRNGLAYAKKMGWNTRVKSLDGGAAFIGNGYILQGQDTLYLQKFDIEHGSSSLHQYMQNIMAPYTEGQSMKKMYSEAGSLNSNFVFKIPVFYNMPGANYTLSPTSVKIEKGKTKQLTLKCNGVVVSASEAEYSSSNDNVATVSSSGLITAKNSGNAVITAKVGEGDNKIELTCKVKVYVPLKSISLEIEDTELYVAEGLPDKVPVLYEGVTTYLNKEECKSQTTIQVIYNPEDTTDNKDTVWKVEDTDVVELKADEETAGKAVITAKKGGTTKITAKVGGFTSTVSVTVRVPMTEASLKLDSEILTLYKGEKTRVNISYAPYETTDPIDPIWSSADETVAKVVDGEIVAVGAGTTTLYASVGAFVGSQTDVKGLSCKIEVKEYSVTFMDENDEVILTVPGEYGSRLEQLNTTEEIPWLLQKEGFVFAGWYTEKNGGGAAVDKDVVLHGDMVLYPYFIDGKEGFYATPIGTIAYTGAYLKPKVEVYNGENLLTYGTDYSVIYVNNKAVNDQSVTTLQPAVLIYGKGLYSGKQYNAYFDIIPKDISHTDVTATNLLNGYTGKEQQMRPVLYDGGRILQRDIDYTLSYVEDSREEGAYLEAGTYAVEVNGIGNYSGSRRIHLTISKRTLMSEVEVSDIPDMKFNNGKSYSSSEDITDCIPKKIAVTYKGTSLLEGKDYSLEYVDNKEIGTASVVLTGMGDYIGKTVKTFAITGTSISKVTVKGITDVEYTGKTAAQDLSKLKLVNPNGTLLREGVDYTLDIKRITAGTAYVTITGINGYFGTLKKSFQIKPYNIVINNQTYFVEGENNTDVEIPAFAILMDEEAVEYDKAGAKKAIVVTFKGRTLVEGVDYILSYENIHPTESGKKQSPTVSITGIGNFTGTLRKTFTLTQKDLVKVDMHIDDVKFRNRRGYCFVKPVLRDASGRYLEAGIDYEQEIIYTYEKDTTLYNGEVREAGREVLPEDIPVAGSVIRITVVGKGNYTGTISSSFEILENDMWLANVLEIFG